VIRVSTGILLLFLVGCGNQSSFQKTPSTLAVEPDLADAGTVVVGGTVTMDLTLSHVTGPDIAVSNVSVENTEGEYFSVDGSTPTVPHLGSTTVTVTYAPTAEGYHQGDLTITYNNEESPTLTVLLRGHALTGSARVRPGLLDFGAVDTGDSKALSVELVNDGGVDLTVTGASFSTGEFALALTTPATLPADGTLEVPIEFTASSTDAMDATGELLLDGNVTVSELILRANDCERGDPSVYDADGDGYTVCGQDCDDDDASAHPGGEEVANGRDEDCDGIIDEGTSAYDDDADGFSEDAGDCNDGDYDVNPAENEDLTNGVDDDCDGVVDQGTLDNDADGYSEPGGDCNDDEPTVFPGAQELADGLDNDCDGLVDEGTSVADDDGDGLSEADGDCDDTDATVYTGAPEVADGVDNDCDGAVDEGTDNADDDGDGFTENGGDCDDSNAAVSPAAAEVPRNGVDDDCDGVTS